MGTGFEGTFVISWSQTETDGLAGAPVESLTVGATWRWAGQAERVDGPAGLTVLGDAEGVAELHQRAARAVRRMIGELVPLDQPPEPGSEDDRLFDQTFVLTDGRRSYTGAWISAGPQHLGLAAFFDGLPPQNRELWIARITTTARAEARASMVQEPGGVICFTPGTRIATPDGPKLVEDLVAGDMIQTKDDGAQPVIWCGAKRMTGARLYAMPKLRPIRIRAGALGVDRPDGDLLVSPDHRLLVEGPAAQALFNEPEVLVRAEDLLDQPGVLVDLTLKEVCYVHLLLERHQILFANGVESESFHPSEADMNKLDRLDRLRLLDVLPGLEHQPDAYGQSARRNLSTAEAAIMTSDMVTV